MPLFIIKSPLKYLTVGQIACLDPSIMGRDPEWCKGKMKCRVQRFLQDKQSTGGLLSLSAWRRWGVPLFQTRGATTWCFSSSNSQPGLIPSSEFLSTLLSHAHATVERGFSVNREVETWNCWDPETSLWPARTWYRIYLDGERRKREGVCVDVREKLRKMNRKNGNRKGWCWRRCTPAFRRILTN